VLDTPTKRRIDTARDILVGKVPDPKSQVEQITIALIYKFMDDMDAESEEMGGQRKFFAGDFARYGWAKLMRAGLGGHETLNLYAEAISRMPENDGIPPLFRDIFKNAYLPYRDPETLRAFLKVIDEFTYDHSERLGDAFEYLLSVLGSQGDAGQFRTPRHIIDFIVSVVDPKKNETVLDPACGTAGFLISSYKHILKANADERGQGTLTPDEKARLARSFYGYDISPDMVRLSLVNLYLHGFTNPNISEYDTLTSEERWNEYFDVILANPPFMSPKGGIRPHRRFSVESKRSEVLFVDYMAEHLKPGGRAGIIVPEGIIFQSGGAYKQLRRMLVEDFLVAVVSLPAGVFQPYSGVKTSILILDSSLARKASTIGFFKVENDGFGLGAQRREIDKNDLPQVKAEIDAYLGRLRSGASLDDFQSTLGQIVEKDRIAANGDYNLSGERYRQGSASQHDIEFRSIGEIAEQIKSGFASGKSSIDAEGVPHIRPMNITELGQFTWNGLKKVSFEEFSGKEDYKLVSGDVLFNNTNSKELVGKTCFIDNDINGGYSNHMTRIRVSESICNAKYLALALHDAWKRGLFLELANRWIGQAGINATTLSQFKIPLPPLEVQQEIVAEIESYQKVIDGARAVVENYRPHIAIDPEWPMSLLGEVCDNFQNGANFSKEQMGKGVKFINIKDLFSSGYINCMTLDRVNLSAVEISRKRVLTNDLLFVRSSVKEEGVGFPSLMSSCVDDVVFCGFIIKCTPNINVILPSFLLNLLRTTYYRNLVVGLSNRANITNISQDSLKSVAIPQPPLETQQAIVAEIEAEQALVAANRELIERMERKIQAVLDRVWGSASVDA
jgi:type I restriction enzyme M protein